MLLVDALATAAYRMMSDREIMEFDYALAHMEISRPVDVPLEEWIARRAELGDRIAAIKAARVAPAPAPVETVECPRCHTQTPKSAMMSGSLRSLCPDCYDEEEGSL